MPDRVKVKSYFHMVIAKMSLKMAEKSKIDLDNIKSRLKY